MQAYLGSRLLDVALRIPSYLRQALQHPKPGREFLIACCARGCRPRWSAARASRGSQRTGPGCSRARCVGRAWPSATTPRSWTSTPPRSEIDSVAATPHARQHRLGDTRQVGADPRAGPEDPGGRQARRRSPPRRGRADHRRAAAPRRRLPGRARLPAAVRDRLQREVVSGPARGSPGDRQRQRRLRGLAVQLEAPCQTCAGERTARWPARGRMRSGRDARPAPGPVARRDR